MTRDVRHGDAHAHAPVELRQELRVEVLRQRCARRGGGRHRLKAVAVGCGAILKMFQEVVAAIAPCRSAAQLHLFLRLAGRGAFASGKSANGFSVERQISQSETRILFEG